MANRKIEEKLERLGLLREASRSEAIVALRTSIEDRANVVVAKAAKIAAELELHDLIPDLVRAFDRLFEKPVERDPQCWGKNAIAITLRDLGYQSAEPFVRGLRHIQMEPVWGGREDTAQVLRAACCAALPQCADLTRDEVLRHLVDAFTDVSDKVRVDAARSLEHMGGADCALLLRLKARVGDKEAQVTGQAFESLLRLERDGSPSVCGGIPPFPRRRGLRRSGAGPRLFASSGCPDHLERGLETRAGLESKASLPARHQRFAPARGYRIPVGLAAQRPRRRGRSNARCPGASSRFRRDQEDGGRGDHEQRRRRSPRTVSAVIQLRALVLTTLKRAESDSFQLFFEQLFPI